MHTLITIAIIQWLVFFIITLCFALPRASCNAGPYWKGNSFCSTRNTQIRAGKFRLLFAKTEDGYDIPGEKLSEEISRRMQLLDVEMLAAV